MRSLVVLCLIAISACSRPAGIFVVDNARAHVGMLAGTIGSRPVGTPANARAREYIVDQLRQYGYDVRVQETDARRHELGTTARVANIIGVLRGERPEGLGLVSHYDSVPDAPGATDDALSVAVSLEAARVFAGNGKRRWTLFVLVTDGEERGLLGAAGLVTDRDVTSRLQAYINLDSIGSSTPSILFETGPANGWLVSAWARRAPHPRGGSHALEVYQRLPNDTDFSILKTIDIPGLNFAAIGDSYSYHTARDTPERLSRNVIRTTGENVVSLVTALQDVDITQRQPQTATFFDIGGAAAVSYGPVIQLMLAALAVALGIIAWVRVTAGAIGENGVLRWIITLVWSWIGGALVVASMVGATWLLRTAREVYHPWYARPGRLFLLLILIGTTVGWSITRLGQWLPQRAHPTRHPALAWSVALPAWILLTALALWFAPAAAYLWVVPLVVAGLLLTLLPASNDLATRAASLIIFVVAGTVWIPEMRDLLRFVVAIMGRLPIITPVATYAVLLATAGMMVVPPLIGLLATERPLLRPWLVTAVLLLATAAAAGAAYIAPAYTTEQPLRRYVRALQEPDAQSAIWEVASVEPGLDLNGDAPGTWLPTTSSPTTSVPWGRFTFPFVFRTTGPSLGPAPASVAAFAIKPLEGGQQLSISVVPREPGVTISFILPVGLSPARSSLPGRERIGRWTASFVAPPPEGISWEASFSNGSIEQLRGVRVVVSSNRLPGGGGWQSLPSWLPQDTAVWSATATWIVEAAAGFGIAPVPPLR